MAHILIVDDNEADRLLIASMLKGEHHLYFAPNGEQAMKLFLRQPIQLIITDIQMPRGDGIELIDAIKGLNQEVAVVAITGKDPDRLDSAVKVGASAILRKPISGAALKEAIETAIKKTAKSAADKASSEESAEV